MRQDEKKCLNDKDYKFIHLSGSATAKTFGTPKIHKLTHSDHFFKLPPVSIILGTFDCNLAKFTTTGDIRAKFGITNLPQSPDIRQKTDRIFF